MFRKELKNIKLSEAADLYYCSCPTLAPQRRRAADSPSTYSPITMLLLLSPANPITHPLLLFQPTDNETELAYSDVQRKITTWRTSNPSQDVLQDHLKLNNTVDKRKGLILVTSLIDKLPNLGGRLV